ncbi:MAG TPA: hypothetical protein VEK05_10925 [Burkholderiales bacterium]|nr:hypothetical protein [Burkholderiales bacterium]
MKWPSPLGIVCAARTSVAAVVVVLASALSSRAATSNDFPTIERVLFVESCAREHPDRPRQEMLYKCSCALDAIAGELQYEEYVELATAADAGQIAGERGAAVRESSEGKSMGTRYKAIRSKAFHSCLVE